VRGTRGDVLQIDPQDLERNFSINVTSLLHLTQWIAPHMIERGQGAIMVTGQHGSPARQVVLCRFRADRRPRSGYSPESMARRLGPTGSRRRTSSSTR
jgi:NAD(P)-dependent dehydrogenase (short-subunit alcohol dehydrogenase family)